MSKSCLHVQQNINFTRTRRALLLLLVRHSRDSTEVQSVAQGQAYCDTIQVTSHSPRFALATHFSELVAINLLFNAGAYL